MTDRRRLPTDRAVDFRLARSPESPGAARDQAGGWLDSLDVHPALRSDVVIAISELVTNAVTHAASAPHVRLTAQDGRIRLEVHDTSDRRPVQKTGSAAGGFGLRLIEQLAENWGWTPSEAGGKVVWVEFDAHRAQSALYPPLNGES